MSNIFRKNDSGISTDSSGLTQSNSVFGDGIVATRVPTGVGQFFYGIDDRFANPSVTGGGTITITGEAGHENLLTVSTSTTTSSTASTENTEYLRYVPGYEFGAWFTTVMTPPTGDGYIKAGLHDGDNGFWIGYKDDGSGQSFGIARCKDGNEFFTKQENFNVDKLDGTGASGLNINTTFGNIFRIRGGYLGFAEILFEVIAPDGKIVLFHRIEYPNSSAETHISNTNLPARIEVSNGTTAENVVCKVGSYCTYVTDGASASVNDRNFSLGIANIALDGTGGYTRRTVISFSNPATFQGNLMPTAKVNRIPAKLNFFSLALDGQNKTGLLEIIIVDSSLNTGGTFTPKDSGNSLLHYSEDATYNYNGTEEVIFSDSFGALDDKKLSVFLKDLNLLLNPDKHAVFAITSTTTNNIDATYSISWSELF